MAIQARSMVSVQTQSGPPRIAPRRVDPKTFAASAGGSAVALVPGNLVAYNTSTNLWVPWDPAGANGAATISGIVWGDGGTIKASGGGEVVINVMTRGTAHYADLTAVAGVSATANQIAAALRSSSLREKGIDIEGLDQFR